MSLLTVEGTYKDGKIRLAEPPQGVQEARVLVTFLPQQKPLPPRYMTFGQLRGNSDRMSDEDDFKIAEWHPKPEDMDV
jgi:hypothetical protein